MTALKPIFCTNCGSQISPNDRFCTNCGSSIVRSLDSDATNQPVPPSAPSWNSVSRREILVVTSVVVLAVVGGIALLQHHVENIENEKKFKEAQAEQVLQRTIAQAAAQKRAEFDAMTPEQHYAAAETLLKNDADSTSISEAQAHIQAIPQNSRESAKANMLWSRFTGVKKQRDAALERQQAEELKKEAELNEAAMITVRDNLAKSIEGQMLDEGYEMDVKAIGPSKTTLYIRYALAGKVFAHQFSQQEGIFQNARQAGFKEIRVSDGYEYTWTWKL